MSLLDALLLESSRINVWIAYRTDGIKGSGTVSDPYDGSSATKFDQLMRDFAAMSDTIPGTARLLSLAAKLRSEANRESAPVRLTTAVRDIPSDERFCLSECWLAAISTADVGGI